MRIATWNVNSVRARKGRVLAWLERVQPGVVCLQELKGEEQNFPALEFTEAGYRNAVFGQKTYNGVAILAREELRQIERGFGDGVEDTQARLISAVTDGIQLVSIYAPNGQLPGSDKYAYKLAWFDRLYDWIRRQLTSARSLVVCGDLNIALDDRDVDDPSAWEGTVLYNEELRTALRRLLELGLVDVFRLHNSEGGSFSWWDYRQGSFRRNRGLRIDYILMSDDLAERCTACTIDREERAGQKPSDHAPVIAVVDR